MWWCIPGISVRVGSEQEAIDFVNWFCDLPYRHKILICGNHDVCLYGADIDGLDDNVHYLCNSGIEIDGLKFYGVPMFMGDCISDRQSRNYAKIPSDTDILITHSPAYGILDLDDNINYGSEEILDRLTALNLKAHLFGHIYAHTWNEISQWHNLFQRGDNEFRLHKSLAVQCNCRLEPSPGVRPMRRGCGVGLRGRRCPAPRMRGRRHREVGGGAGRRVCRLPLVSGRRPSFLWPRRCRASAD